MSDPFVVPVAGYGPTTSRQRGGEITHHPCTVEMLLLDKATHYGSLNDHWRFGHFQPGVPGTRHCPGRALATAGGFLISPSFGGRVGEMLRAFPGIQPGQMTGLCDDIQIQEFYGPVARMRSNGPNVVRSPRESFARETEFSGPCGEASTRTGSFKSHIYETVKGAVE